METNSFYSVPPISPPFRISKMCFGVTSLWIESSLTSGTEHSSAHPNLLYPVQGGPLLLRYACEEALETTQLQAPDSLSYNGSFGAKRTRKMMHVLKFTTFPEMCAIDPGQRKALLFLKEMPF